MVSTTIDLEKGILVKLPPFDPNVNPVITSSRNFCQIHLNAVNEIMIDGEYKSIEEIRPYIKNFIMNPDKETKYAKRPNKAVIAINNDRATLYKDYLALYNEIKMAYNELWQKYAKEKFSKSFNECGTEERRKVKRMIPLIISEMEPVSPYILAK